MNWTVIIAVALCCLTALLITYMIIKSKQPKVIVARETKQEPVQAESEDKKPQDDTMTDIAANSMDAVIKAANTLMGIDIIDKEENANGEE